MENPKGGWLLIPATSQPDEIVSSQSAHDTTRRLSVPDMLTWQTISIPEDEDITWFLGGTSTDWGGIPLAIVLVLEDRDPDLATAIGQAILKAAMEP